MPVTLPLSAPIEAHGEPVKELTFRDPTAKDIRVMGFPFVVTKEADIVPDAAAIARYIVTLAGIPTSSVDRLAPRDFLAATMAVMGFFGEPASS
jgi:hypothetical protein